MTVARDAAARPLRHVRMVGAHSVRRERLVGSYRVRHGLRAVHRRGVDGRAPRQRLALRVESLDEPNQFCVVVGAVENEGTSDLNQFVVVDVSFVVDVPAEVPPYDYVIGALDECGDRPAANVAAHRADIYRHSPVG